MSDTLTMPFPFLAEVPKRERSAILDGWAELEEFQEMVRQDGAAIPVTFAARLLDISRQRIYELIDSGRLQKMELAGHVFVNAESLRLWGEAEHKAGRPAGVLGEKNRVKAGIAVAKASHAYGKEVVAGRHKKAQK